MNGFRVRVTGQVRTTMDAHLVAQAAVLLVRQWQRDPDGIPPHGIACDEGGSDV